MDMEPEILYEDNHIIAVEKPSGVPTQGDITGIPSLHEMITGYIRVKYAKPGNVFLGIVHRLDRPVSGIVLFARTSKGAERLSQQFRSRTVLKIYLALVENPGKASGKGWVMLEHSLRRHRGFSEALDAGEDDGQEARLEYHLLDRNDHYALLAVHLLTGRKHQIRAQLASMGMPVAGDTRYGSTEVMKGDAICLHAHMIRFVHPTRKESMTIVSPPPSRMTTRMPLSSQAGNRLSDAIQTLDSRENMD